MRIKILTSIAFTALAMITASPADAESRMAGSVHVSKPPVKSYERYEEKTYSNDAVHQVNFRRLESHGLLTRTSEGSLGRDLWLGSKRSDLINYLPQISGTTPYRTINDLSRRLLLTKTDVELIKQDQKPEPGNDLTTLRLEKLLEMGAYKDALSLYTKHPDVPYHERYARAGILAALYSKQAALACLEEKTIESRIQQFEDVVFWQQISKICSYILSKQGKLSPAPSADKLKFPESDILRQVATKKNFRYKVKKPADLETLTPLEAAVLAADDRFDFSTLKISSDKPLPIHVIALLITEPSLPEHTLFKLMLQAVEAGLKTTDELAAYYESKAEEHFGKKNSKTSLTGYQSVKGWKRLPYLYRGITNTGKRAEREAIIQKVFDLASDYEIVALWPFAEAIAELDPTKLGTDNTRIGFKTIVQAGVKPSKKWSNAWNAYLSQNSGMGKLYFLELFAYGIGQNVTENDDVQNVDFSNIIEEFDAQEHEILKIVYEKLDKRVELHNYSGGNIYEKQSGLTSAVDYVMPSISLLDSLEKAEYEQRLGEVILLSSIALRDVPPGKVYAGVFREVIDGLTTVGLTKEAQSLAREVILGLSEK